MDILSALDEIEKMELKLSDLYDYFHKLFSEDKTISGLFYRMSLDEKSHFDLARYQRNLVRKNYKLFEEIDIDAEEIKRVVEKVDMLIKAVPTPTVEEALRYALEFEANAAEYHYRTAMEQSNADVATLLKSLGSADNEHSNSLREMARSRGFGI